ncbi:MAG: 16S rRNA (guanine(966)-N(2))-methyltransferase RsmD [Gammaproteobacteria bacterium]|nr:16S rRNA (guanine(966)-N(2))-methyltransferase RsmD [Gammaproteobacteria bacterium]
MNKSSIRIIGGRNKSYRIVFKASSILRPTSDRAKETLFSWLQFEIKNKSCLDLFAGTGGLGFEALSRGAKHATFVEKDSFLFKNILQNIEHLKYEKRVEVECNDAFKWLKKNKKRFDYIFLDPPFNFIQYKKLLQEIYQKNVLKKYGKIYLEISKHSGFEFNNSYIILKEKIIGDVRIIILQ